MRGLWNQKNKEAFVKVRTEWWEEMERLKGVPERSHAMYLRHAMVGHQGTFWDFMRQEQCKALVGAPVMLELPCLRSSNVKVRTGSLKFLIRTRDGTASVKSCLWISACSPP